MGNVSCRDGAPASFSLGWFTNVYVYDAYHGLFVGNAWANSVDCDRKEQKDIRATSPFFSSKFALVSEGGEQRYSAVGLQQRGELLIHDCARDCAKEDSNGTAKEDEEGGEGEEVQSIDFSCDGEVAHAGARTHKKRRGGKRNRGLRTYRCRLAAKTQSRINGYVLRRVSPASSRPLDDVDSTTDTFASAVDAGAQQT